MQPNRLTVQPFALDEAELKDIEKFAEKNDLHSIARLCAELRALRIAYLEACTRNGKRQNSRPDPILANKRWGNDMEVIINYGGHTSASPVA